MERHNEEEEEEEAGSVCLWMCRSCAVPGAQQEGRKLVHTFIFRSDEDQVCRGYNAAGATCSVLSSALLSSFYLVFFFNFS